MADSDELMARYRSIDIFCHVVDNLGDVGVTWRLAQQLAAEKNCAVRLIIDDLVLCKKMAPDVDIHKHIQKVIDVEILHWTDNLADIYAAPGDVVIEAFACNLPDFVIHLMMRQKPAPIWIDLEYLSAENWVEDCHAIVSAHPTGINKTLFFPGFTPRTGGLIREQNLLQQRDQFQNSTTLQNVWRKGRGLPVIDQKTLDISLFCYSNAPVSTLLNGLSVRSARIFAPQEIAAQLLQHETYGTEIVAFDFMPQNDYDRLLWTCNLNFVRGEDSFVRALWAGRPYVWHIYQQQEDAHFVKLDAFLRHYSENLAPQDAEVLADFSGMWNVRGQATDVVTRFFDRLPAFAEFAPKRAAEQAQQDDLATQLIRFIETQIGA